MSLKTAVRSLSNSLDKVHLPSDLDRYTAWRIAQQRVWETFNNGTATPEAWPDLTPAYPVDEADEGKYLALLGVAVEEHGGEIVLKGWGMRVWAIREAQRLRITDRPEVQALWPNPDLSELPADWDFDTSPLLDSIVFVLKAASRAAGCYWEPAGP